MSRLIVTITGPSCAGKSTLEGLLKERLGFENAISTTTRQKREGEIDGVHYYFISKSEFARHKACGAFVESVEFDDNSYAVSAHEVNRVFSLGKPVVVVVEPGGQKQIHDYARNAGWNLYSVFVSNTSAVIADRFLNRLEAEMQLYPQMSPKRTKIFSTYAKRLGVMMSLERSWVAEAAASDGLYNYRAWEFDETCVEETLAAIEEATTEEKETL